MIKCSNKFWLENISDLFCSLTIIPLNGMSLENGMNSLSRLVILIYLILILFSYKHSILFILLSLLFIIILYYIQKKTMEQFNSEHFTNQYVNNSNVNNPTFNYSTIPIGSNIDTMNSTQNKQLRNLQNNNLRNLHNQYLNNTKITNNLIGSGGNEFSRKAGFNSLKSAYTPLKVNQYSTNNKNNLIRLSDNGLPGPYNKTKVSIETPTTYRFCDDGISFYSNNNESPDVNPDYISINQKLVGPANPKTAINPVIIAPIYSDDYWRGNNLSIPNMINEESNQDVYQSGYQVSTCCGYTDDKYIIPSNLIKDNVNKKIDTRFINLNSKENFEDTNCVGCNTNNMSNNTSNNMTNNMTNNNNNMTNTNTNITNNNTKVDYGNNPNMRTNKDCPVSEGPIVKSKKYKVKENQPGWVLTNDGNNYNPDLFDEYGLPVNDNVASCDLNTNMKNYNKNLATQTLQPDVYIISEIDEPINSNIGISYQQQIPPLSCKTDGKSVLYTQHDPRTYEPNNIIEPLTSVPTVDNIYDPRHSGYSTSYRAYSDKLLGNTKFMYTDIDAIRMPNYITRNYLDSQPFASQIGSMDSNNSNDNTANIRALAQDAFTRSTIQQRTDIQESLMRKNNTMVRQNRQAPKNVGGQKNLGYRRI
jgi:hypothetical protein